MKKLFSAWIAMSIALVLTLFVMPIVLAEEFELGGGVNVDAGIDGCVPPEIYTDHTARGWYPNDQTRLTAGIYGALEVGGKFNLTSPTYDRYTLSERMNYVFTGETLQYYVVVVDQNGDSDIDSVQLLVGGSPVGSCLDVGDDTFNDTVGVIAFKGENGLLLGEYPTGYNDLIMDSYVCTLIVASSMTTEAAVAIRVTDGGEQVCELQPNIVDSIDTDLINFNPTLTLSLIGGPVDFGGVVSGSTAI